MRSRKSKKPAAGFSRREFLLTVGATAPTIRLMEGEASGAPNPVPETEAGDVGGKFTPVDLGAFFNCSPREFGTRERAALIGGDSAQDLLIRVTGGKRDLQGIPFILGPEDLQSKGWLVLSAKSGPAAAARVEIPVWEKFHFLCVASFSDFDENETPAPDKDVFQKVGQHLADVTIFYKDGGTSVLPIRRRFETNAPLDFWGHASFAALPQGKLRASKLTDPLSNALGWGYLQRCIAGGPAGGPGMGIVWVCALENPAPDRAIRSVRMEAASEDALVVCGLTLYHRSSHPLRSEPRAIYRLALPEPAAEDEKRWQLDVDLGTVGRTFVLPDFDPQAWLAAPARGLGEEAKVSPSVRYLYAEVIANRNATLTLRDSKTGKQYSFDLSQVAAGSELEATEGGGSIEIVEQGRRWVHCRVIDGGSKQPTPVRLALRSKEGRYIPPYGHRTEINDEWFQDYGADVKLMDTSFAYVDGTFQVELPPGEAYVEMTKGFEYQAVRQKIEIQPGQSELTLEIPRLINLRAKGWVTADTHTHFLAPTTALLEAQAEGLNLINLLAAQWGALYTNVGDLSYGPVISADRESMVWVGTENRHHILGHISLEGAKRNAIFPLSTDTPYESYLGDTLWTSLAEWADACRRRQGLVVSPHFPYPTGEVAADIVLGKIDAVEIWPQDDPKVHATVMEEFDSLRYRDWYHYLNCGYRLPAVAGTDKMGAYIPAGANRVYAYLGQEEFYYPNFARAVRAGNTFASSGPLLMFHADGRSPGGEITLGAGGGSIEVTADAQCFVPIHRLEVIFNGKVVASREERSGAQAMHLAEKIYVDGPGWLAARCSSQSGPTSSWLFKIAAHTSPVYVQVPGRELFSPEAAAYFLNLIDGAQMYVETLATRPDAETFARIRKVYTDARAQLHRRLHQHGVPH
jgi:hypothetical protein